MIRKLATAGAVAAALLFGIASAASANEIVLNDSAAAGSKASNYVDDTVGVLTDADIESINGAANRIRDTYWLAIAAEFRDGTDGLPIDEYATQRAADIGLGDAETSNGLFYVVDMESRDYYVAKGDGVGKVINDAELEAILDTELAPNLSSEEYAKGIVDSATTVGKIYSGEAKPEYLTSVGGDPDESIGSEFADSDNSGGVIGAVVVAGLIGVGLVAAMSLSSRNGDRRLRLEKKAANDLYERMKSSPAGFDSYINLPNREKRLKVLTDKAPNAKVDPKRLEQELNILIAGEYINVHSNESVKFAMDLLKEVAENRVKGRDIWGKMSKGEQKAYRAIRTDSERTRYLDELGYGRNANMLVMLAMFGSFGLLTHQSIAQAEAMRQQQSLLSQSPMNNGQQSNFFSPDSNHFGGGGFGSGGGAGGSF